MNKELLKAIMAVVQAKINYALENERGRDSGAEYLALDRVERELEEFFDKDTHELAAAPRAKPESISDFFTREISDDWWLEHLGENRSPILHRGDNHRVDDNPHRRWECRLQHVTGGFLTIACGPTPFQALRTCAAIVRSQHGG